MFTAVSFAQDNLTLTKDEISQVRVANLKIENSKLREALLQEQIARLTKQVQDQKDTVNTEKINLINSLATKHSVDLTKYTLDETKGIFVVK